LKKRAFRSGLNIHFYDEREWRYVPEISENYNSNSLAFINKNRFDDKAWQKTLNDIAKQVFLEYEVSNIKYIIMPNYSIEAFEKLIDKPKHKFNSHKAELFSKIITIEQIKEDV